MAKKKGSYIGVELDFAESQLAQWKEEIKNNPIGELEDRFSPKGALVQDKESQGKYYTELLAKFLSLAAEVDSLREKEAAKLKVRGDQDLTPLEDGDI